MVVSKKRKRVENGAEKANGGSAVATKKPDEDQAAWVRRLESGIVKSKRHYNDLAVLLAALREETAEDGDPVDIAVALCRTFTQLRAAGSLTVRRDAATDGDIVIVKWLKERYHEYQNALMNMLGLPLHSVLALNLLLRMIKSEKDFSTTDESLVMSRLQQVVLRLIEIPDGLEARQEFLDKFVKNFDDIRFGTFSAIGDLNTADYAPEQTESVSRNTLYILSAIDGLPSTTEDTTRFYFGQPGRKSAVLSMAAHKRSAQHAWMKLLQIGLNKEQRKKVLGMMSQRIAPWFIRAEALMDFLTDSFDVGGSTSLLALSGLFYLMQEKNLDYPMFYPKLYSLLNRDLLHSRHRSRFFRLLDTFLGSTHLPGALVASFIKRMARLALFAPPAAIVVIVPWIYNLFKKHPSCTFMIHRETRDLEAKEALQLHGIDDPFDMHEQDPMESGAIDSSLWEIEMLQSHYHPNVATLAKIISEQFTKHAYNLEDFLDHSYSSMLEAELSKDMKKTPVVEFEIPKHIFTKQDAGSLVEDGLLVKLWDFPGRDEAKNE